MAEKIKKQNKFLDFLKRNLALVIIIACVVAIVTIVVVESANTTPPAKRPEIDIGGGGIAGGGDDTIVDVKPLTFDLPMADYTISMDFTVDGDFVYSSSMEEWTSHRGIDFVAKGSKDVKAVADGKVESVTVDDEYGTKIVIDHGDGLKSIYSSLAENPAVKKGDSVKKGDKIGEASDSAYIEWKDGPHVHFEMTKNGKQISPREYLKID